MDKGIEPIYMRHKDLKMRDVTSYTVCQAMERIVGKRKVEGAQLINYMWRLYVRDKESRIQLLSKKEMLVINRNVQLFDQHPGKLRADVKQMDKLTIKFVPLYVENGEIQKMLEDNGAKLMSEIKFGYEKDLNGNLTSFKNGDRFVFIEPLDPPVKRSQTVSGYQVAVIHHGKDNKPCLACNQLGHRVGNQECPALPKEKIYTFRGYRHPLSNHYPCELNVFEHTFKSVEHAYFWKMAMDFDLSHQASKIKNAAHAGIAKTLSKDIADEDDRYEWECDVGIGIMKEIVSEKFRQVPEFVRCIYDHRDHVFAEVNPSRLWATAMSEYVTRHTTPGNWIGQNILGRIITSVAENIDELLQELSEKGGAEKIYYDLGFDIRPEYMRSSWDGEDEAGEEDVQPDAFKKMWCDKYDCKNDSVFEDEKSEEKSEEAVSVDIKKDVPKDNDSDEIPIADMNTCTPNNNNNSSNNNNNSNNNKAAFKGRHKMKSILTRVKGTGGRERATSTSTNVLLEEGDIDKFLDFLDTKYSEIQAQKRKETASSPAKDVEQEAKIQRVETT